MAVARTTLTVLAASLVFCVIHLDAEAQCNTWQPVSAGFNNNVFAATVFNGRLVVAGRFQTSGATSINRIAQWDGTSWQPLGAGVPGSGTVVDALAVYNGKLIAGGTFLTTDGAAGNNIQQWNGSTWQALGSGTTDSVLALTVYNNQLIVGGAFTNAGGGSANYIARWDGNTQSWFTLGTLGGPLTAAVQALTVYNNNLIVGGEFPNVTGVGAHYIAQWNGGTWSPVGTGAPNNIVRALAVYHNNLIIGGDFTNSSVPGPYAALWNGTAWQQMGGLSNSVRTITVYNGKLIIGGDFVSASGFSANHVAYTTALNWTAIGGGTDSGVRALSDYNGNLIVGGAFSNAGSPSVSALHIAQWRDCNLCPGDVAPANGGNGTVNIDDLVTVITNWGALGENPGDANHDGIVNIDDLVTVITTWGACP